MVPVLQHDRDRASRVAFWRLHAERDAQIVGNRKVDRHLDAMHRTPNDDPFPGQFDVAYASVGRPVGSRELHR